MFRPSKKQWRAWKELQDFKRLVVTYGGAAFGGKTYLGAYWVMTQCLQHAGAVYAVARNELTTLKKTTLVTMFKVFAAEGLIPDVHYTYNQQLNYIQFSNGSIIRLCDLAYKPSDPLYTRLGGLELTGAWIDEAAESSETGYRILLTRIGRWRNKELGVPRKMLLTLNPAKTFVYYMIYRPWKEGNLDERYCFIQALPQDNPAPEAEEYADTIRATGDRTTIERLLMGNWEYDDDPTTLITTEAISWMTKVDQNRGQKYLSCDIADMGSDSTVIVAWDGWTIVEIKKIDKADGAEKVKQIKAMAQKYNVPMSNIVYDADGVGSYLRGYLPGAYSFVNNSKALGGEHYTNLKSQCYFHLAKKIMDGDIALLDDRHFEALRQELEQVKRHRPDDDGKLSILPKSKVKEILGRSPDVSDAVMMRMAFTLKGLTAGARIKGI